VFGKKTCLIAALGLLLVFTAAAWAQQNQYTQLQRGIIEDRLRRFGGNDMARETALKKLFEEAGCSGSRLQEQPVKHADAPNVLCTLPGSGNKTIVVGAHFDYVDKGSGVADNWSGASLLPSLYQSLSSAARQYTFVFIGFSDEEEGFVGSTFYVNQLTAEQAASVKAMIDIDTLGLGPTEIWVTNSDPELVELMNSVASAMKLPAHEMNVDGIGDSDGRSFKQRKVPIITLHSVTDETLGILHTSKDNITAIKLDDYYGSYKLIAGYLAALDKK
jgi:hypothetical protein